MKSVSISGSLRENVGKKDAKAQRSNGMIPCVVYGGKEQKTFVVDEKQFKQLLYTPEVLFVELNIDGFQTKAIVQEAQFHPITDKLLHVDFLEVIDNKPITISLPLKVKGTAPGVLKGGLLQKKIRKIKVRGLLENIPEEVNIDISSMEINDMIKVADIQLDNISVVDQPNKIVISINPTRNAIMTDDSAEADAEA